MTDEEFQHQFDADMARQSEEFRQFILGEGRPDLVAKYDERMRLERLGITGARRTWHSISPAQRRALVFVQDAGGKIGDVGGHFIGPHLCVPVHPIRIKTVRNLCARECLAWDGGAFDPECAAVLTERGRFVLAHGPMPAGQKFEG